VNCTRCDRELPSGASVCPSCRAVVATAPGPAHLPVPDDDSPTLPSTDRARSLASIRPGTLPAANVENLAPGTLLASRYRILGFAGRGAMGEVYRAEDRNLGQIVALKFLPDEFARDPDRRSRLLNEVRVARQVSHPNVCRVHDAGETEGRPFLSMEWVEGENLAALLARRGRLAEEEAVRLARHLCEGLAAVHERGVLHRDLKPSNVLLDARGIPRIADFGLAEAAEVVRGRFAREGTPDYMSPEQLAGAEATARSDVYALGVLLYEIFTGRNPFSAGGSPRPAPAPPSRYAADLAPEIERTILACLNADPARRPPTARQVAGAFPAEATLAQVTSAAQQRADRIVAFRAELAELRRAGVILVDDQGLVAAERYHQGVLRDLASRHEVDLSERGKQLSLGMRVASLIAALALSASVFYFFFALWGRIPTPAQVAVLVAAPLAALAATSAIARRETARYFTGIAALLAWGCFVLNLVALAAVFNLPSAAGGFFAWGVFGLLLGYGYRVRILFVLGALSLAIYVASALYSWAGGSAAEGLARPEGLFPVAAALLLLALAEPRRHPPGFSAAYRLLGSILLLGPIVLLAEFGSLSYLPLGRTKVEVLYQVGGFVVSAALIAVGVARRRRPLVYSGTTAFVLLLLLKFVDWWWEWMPRYLFFLIVALSAVAALLALRRLRAASAVALEGPAS